MSDISELIPSGEALKRIYCKMMGTAYEKLEDLKILAVYKTVTDDYMIALFLLGAYHLMFLSHYRVECETMPLSHFSTEANAKYQARLIAQMIGATLLSED